MLGPPLVSSPFRIMLLESLWRSDSDIEFERVRNCLIDCWWASVRARRSELRCSERSSAEGGYPKMKNFMKKKMSRAIESCPRRKPCVNERLWGISGVRSLNGEAYEEVGISVTGWGTGVETCFAITGCVACAID